jgi:hypothetical protein
VSTVADRSAAQPCDVRSAREAAGSALKSARTSAAFRAGVPQVAVPFTADQPFWASRVALLGERITAEDGIARAVEQFARLA